MSFSSSLDRFYGAIERTAATISDFSQKQHFLNTVYEQFFQGFSVKVADTHGIVYTPQPIVDFMVKSVAEILEREFGRSLADEGRAYHRSVRRARATSSCALCGRSRARRWRASTRESCTATR